MNKRSLGQFRFSQAPKETGHSLLQTILVLGRSMLTTLIRFSITFLVVPSTRNIFTKQELQLRFWLYFVDIIFEQIGHFPAVNWFVISLENDIGLATHCMSLMHRMSRRKYIVSKAMVKLLVSRGYAKNIQQNYSMNSKYSKLSGVLRVPTLSCLNLLGSGLQADSRGLEENPGQLDT